MPNTLALWHAEHVNFCRLLDILEEQQTLFHKGGAPDYALMLDIMFYMTHYPDAFHHPKEDRVFAIIKERKAGAGPAVVELTEQHARLKAGGEALVHMLDDIVNGSIESREQFDAAARDYVTSFRSHMRKEEAEILPLAAGLLRDSDWSAIDDSIRHIVDPMFGPHAEERYASIRRQIAKQAVSAVTTAR